tara:strand:- start:102 stop:275 length:174 start_codon:yes stop_codon:yes gene_type:complete
MNITNAQYTTNIEGSNVAIKCIVDGETVHVPLDTGNRHYDEIMRQVAAGTLTIADAD